jgi:hypothetical protein
MEEHLVIAATAVALVAFSLPVARRKFAAHGVAWWVLAHRIIAGCNVWLVIMLVASRNEPPIVPTDGFDILFVLFGLATLAIQAILYLAPLPFLRVCEVADLPGAEPGVLRDVAFWLLATAPGLALCGWCVAYVEGYVS